jgi:HlyD family secretion protein
MNQQGIEGVVTHPLPELRDLGPIETSYQDLRTELAQARQMLANGYYQHKRQMLQQDLASLRQVKTNADRQAQLAQQDLQLQTTEYRAYEALSKKYEIPPLQLNQYKSKMLAKEQALQQIQSQRHGSDLNIGAKAMELLDLDKTIADQQQRTVARIFDVKSQLDAWIQQYVLVAPTDGAVAFVSAVHDHLMLDAGQELLYIQPAQSQLYAEVMAGERGVGKIRVGQRVLIKVESYPADEFGYVTGNIQEIANLANRSDSFFVKVALPHGLRTNSQKIIAFRNGLTGQAEILTDRRRLSDRLFGQLGQLVRR